MRTAACITAQPEITKSERFDAAKLPVTLRETQNANVPAIDFYRAVGFGLEGVDLSYYSNVDKLAGEVAVFMKRKLEADEE